MRQKPTPTFRYQEPIVLTGVMAVYEDQAQASARIGEQWLQLLATPMPEIEEAEVAYGASPCTSDHKIHYLCGVAASVEAPPEGMQQLVLPAGEYAVFAADEPAASGEMWGWILGEWLPASGYKERSAPEFERFTKDRGSRRIGRSIELGVSVERNTD